MQKIVKRIKKKLAVFRARLLLPEDGQAITEYGAILAFVCVLVALTFSFTNGGFGPAVSAAFSAVTENLNDMSAFIDSAGS